MPFADELLDLAFECHRAGRLDDACQAYRAVLEIDPTNAEAFNLLGVACQQQGDVEQSINLLKQAVQLDPGSADFHHNFGEALRAAKRYPEAIEQYRTAAALNPGAVASWRSLGLGYEITGASDAAIKAWQKAISLEPDHADTHNNLSVAYRRTGQFEAAKAVARRAIEIDPTSVLANRNLVRAQLDLAEYDEAVQSAVAFAKTSPDQTDAHTLAAMSYNLKKEYGNAIQACQFALRTDPQNAEAHFNLGLALDGVGESRGAALAYARTAEIDPDRFAPHINLGLALLAVGELDRAAEAFAAGSKVNPNSIDIMMNLAIAYERANRLDKAFEAARQILEKAPHWPMAISLLGTLHLRRGEHAEAEAEFKRALEVLPTFAPAWNNLATLYAERAEHDKCFDAMRRVMETRPNGQTHNVLVFYMNADPRYSPAEIFEEHRRWDQRWGSPPETWPQFPNAPDPNRRIRVGYVSPDLRSHSVAFFATSFLTHHDHHAFEIFIYDDSTKPDLITDQLKQFADHWTRVVGQNMDQLYDRIREDQIDILIDLTGHTGDNRLIVFGRKAAPVQISYLGYPNTTGLAAMDYRITDAIADPPGLTDAYHSETLIRLPDTFLCYTPGSGTLPVHSPTRAKQDPQGTVTFASFNALTKVTPAVIALWARILRAVPNSRLALKANGLQQPQLRDLFFERFALHGIDADRLELLGRTVAYTDHMILYAKCDIGLDPFPYHGTTTTCEALWMGVPVITLAGQTHVSRVGVSILTNVGLESLITFSEEDYVAKAVQLAGDINALDALRSEIRQKMRPSPLMNAARFTRNLEAVYRSTWGRWCESKHPEVLNH